MLHELLKIITCLSIITVATSSNYITKRSIVSYRHASPSLVENKEPSQVSSNDGDGYKWTKISNEEIQSQAEYLIPKLFNVQNMNSILYSNMKDGYSDKRISTKSATKKLNQKIRGNENSNSKFKALKSNKKSNLMSRFDNGQRKISVENITSEESNAIKNITGSDQQYMKTNKTRSVLTNQNFYPVPSLETSDYPNSFFPTNKEEHELQQLFGLEGAKKYQNFQLQQQARNKDDEYLKLNDDNGFIDAPRKRSNEIVNGEEMQDVSGAMVNQIMPRTTRRQREYDVPLIQCPPATDGMERFACPTPDRQGRYRCIDDHVLCDGFIDCPEGADEDRQACMFYKTTKAHLDVLADALLRWARGR